MGKQLNQLGKLIFSYYKLKGLIMLYILFLIKSNAKTNSFSNYWYGKILIESVSFRSCESLVTLYPNILINEDWPYGSAFKLKQLIDCQCWLQTNFELKNYWNFPQTCFSGLFRLLSKPS